MAAGTIITDFQPTGEVTDNFIPVADAMEPETDSWATTIGKSVMQGLTFIPTSVGALSRFTNDLLGLDLPKDGDLYDISKDAASFWEPKTKGSEAKRHAADITRTIAEMGSALAVTGGAGLLPSIAAGAGVQKYAEARDEGAGFGTAATAGLTQAEIEYLTEKVPIGVLLKPGLSFGRRLAMGLLTDIPGELMATAGEMALVDEQMLGKRYTLDQYLQALKDTAITAAGVTGGMTAISHPFVKQVEAIQEQAKKEPERYEEIFTDGIKAMTEEKAPEGVTTSEPDVADLQAEVPAVKPIPDLTTEEAATVEQATIETDTVTEDAALDLVAEGMDLEALTDEAIQAKIETFEQASVSPVTAQAIPKAGVSPEASVNASIESEKPKRIITDEAYQEAAPIEGTPSLAPVAVDPSVRSIVDDVAGQLEATGKFTAEDASTQAQVYGEAFRVMGKRAGIDPEKLYKKYGVNIGTGFEVSSAAKKEAKAGQSLSDFVRTAGGINSKKEFMTGEVRGFSIKAGYNLINNKTGKTLEQLTEYATSYGYFKERPTIGEFVDALRSDVDAKISGTGTRLYSSEDMGSRLDAELDIQYAEYLEEQRLRNRKQAEPSDFLTKEEYFQSQSGGITAPPFYSKLQQTIETKMGNINTVEQVRGLIKDMKAEEIQWSGIEEFLKGKDKVSKPELLDYLRANDLQIREVTKADTKLEPTPQDLEQMAQLNYGKKYDELNAAQKATVLADAKDALIDNKEVRFAQYQIPGGENYKELLLTLPEKELATAVPFKSSHFTEPNILAHVRFNDRTDSEGKRVLFLEEVQSDWHQKGRDKGYRISPEREAELRATIEKAESYGADATPEQKQAWVDAMNELQPDTIGKKVPEAPFKKTWHEFALKRMIRYAAENGYDKIAWTTGEQQAERYDLSNQVDEILFWGPDTDGDIQPESGEVGISIYDKESNPIIDQEIMSHAELANHIGKELAKRIIEGDAPQAEGHPEGVKSLTGLNLKIGGEGMKGFYDQIIPQFLNKFGKKYGAKVEETKIVKGETERLDEISKSHSVQSLPITTSLSEAALHEGFTMFQRKKGGPARGRIAFGPKGIDIELLQNADKSTFLHETGHFYLKMLGDLATMEGAKKDIATDYATIRAWLKAEKGAPITVKQHEKFARGFEAYLMEGKAPTSQLKVAFERFASWLTEIYKTLTALNVKLTPEVRDVMDRMLADRVELKAKAEGEVQTAEAISQAEGLKSVLPAKGVKAQVNRSAGIKKIVKMIGEDKALSAAWKKAEQNARIAFREGKKEALVEAKAKMKEVLVEVKTRAAEKIAKIKTEKQKTAARRKQINNIVEYLGLTDTQVKKLVKKDIRLMTDFEFHKFQSNLLVKAEAMQEKAFEKARVQEIIERKRLQKAENYRRVLGYPTIDGMTTEQLRDFADTLEQFQDGDVFLTERELETVDRTDLKGIKTWREAKEALAKELGVSVDKLDTIKPSAFDGFKWDASLVESNPFYGLLVETTTKSLMNAEARVHEVENEIYELASKSEKSRKLTIAERLIPQDKQIFEYLEAPADQKAALAAEMTPEQVELARYMRDYFGKALEYLIKTKSLEKGRENYFVHIRRTFLETLKEDGLVNAVLSVFRNYQQDEMVFNILDDDTGNILPLEKFFQFSMRRTDALEPTQNVVKAFLTYARTFEKKVSLDEIIPKLDIYAQSLTPQTLTPRGLETDRSLKKFVNRYINNKKGRQISFDSVIKQGGPVDLSIRALRTFTTILDLGLSLPIGVASFVGERVANFELLGAKGFALGEKRALTAEGKIILKKYEAFTGRSVWEEFTAPGKEVTERVVEGMFGFFHQATVSANKQFLLGSLTEEEFKNGTISEDRLAELRIEMGRWRVVPGGKSLIGSTSIGGAALQYKSWAVVMGRTTVKDLTMLLKDLKNKPIGEALTTKEAHELYRAISLIAAVLIVSGAGDDEDDKSFTGQLVRRIRNESLSILSAISPEMWLATPRIMGFLTQLGKNLQSIIILEEYKTKPGLKGVGGLQRQLTPGAVRPFIQEEKKDSHSRL